MTGFYELHADGACKGNPGPGGWGILIKGADSDQEDSGGVADTTNNRMELMAAIKGLDKIPSGSHVRVCTDSQYVIKGVTEWAAGWQKNGWRNAKKQPVANEELWKELLVSVGLHANVEWKWVKGHSGNVDNERVDKLASAAAQKAQLMSRAFPR